MTIAINSNDSLYDQITQTCLEQFANSNKIMDPVLLSEQIMDLPDFPMHHNIHHYMVPAILLTCCRKAQGHDALVLRRDLEMALERGKQVPPGACGFLGACGASVGIGIFFSIITDSTPLSQSTWEIGNRATAKALNAIADVGGPRCCKRCSWLSILSARQQIENVLKLNLDWPESIHCKYHERNNECLKERCPFYSGDFA